MVKADLTRDYYGDLGLQPTADIAEIKKQFKKLALIYHPDRNPGDDSTTAKFQQIQSAHEVLSDAKERAKYDLNRITSRPNDYRTGYQGASGVRGNPWSSAGSEWAPPPKPPGTHRRPPARPAPSAGAARYGKFASEAPKASANTAKEGPEARKHAWQGWEKMNPKTGESRADDGANRGSYRPPPPSRDYTAPSARDESNSYKYAPPPKPKPGFDEYRTNYSPNVSPQRRAQSSGGAGRKGFTPATPGGDEPAAPKGAYFTQHKSQHAPEPPPRAPPPSSHSVQPDPPRQNVQPDPLRQFKHQVDPAAYDVRQSTPYQTHGGEKLNPFDNANMNRSKSHRERSEKAGVSGRVPRTGSDPNLSHPHRARSFADRPSRPSVGSFHEEAISSSSSEDGPQIKSPRKYAQPRRTPTTSTKDGQRMHEASEHSRKPSLSQFQKWYHESAHSEPPLNGITSDQPATNSGQANVQPTESPNMYGTFQSHSSSSNPATASSRVEEYSEAKLYDYSVKNDKLPSWYRLVDGAIVFPRDFEAGKPGATYPSGIAADGLNSFEAHQHRLVDDLINKRNAGGIKIRSTGMAKLSENDANLNRNGKCSEECAWMGSPSKKQKFQELPRSSPYAYHYHTQSFPVCTGQQKAKANKINYVSSFSFPVDDSTFATTYPPKNGVASPSTENINTKFTPEEWEGKFEAGQDYFRPNQKAGGVPPRGRAQSASRSRGRSPIKIRPIDPKVMQPPAEEETPVESPGGTKFTPEEWEQTFKTQTFMPPPPAMTPRTIGSRKGRGPSIRPTMGGNAAVVEDSDYASEDVSLFTGRKSQAPAIVTSPSLDPMEVDSAPPSESAKQASKTPTTNTVPLGVPSPSKRPAAQSQSPIDSALKVEFDDLKVQDLMSTLSLPTAPSPPETPVSLATRPELYLEEFKNYMADWDLFTNQFAFHMLARKKQNDELGNMRWEDDQGLETYRKGLKEDKFVLAHWSTSQEKHEITLKEYAVWRERMKPSVDQDRPRKKTH